MLTHFTILTPSGKWNAYYRCSIYRSAKGNNCTARLTIKYNPFAEDSEKITIDGSYATHICYASHSPISQNKVGGIVNAKMEMKERCEQVALKDVVKTSIQISNEVLNEFNQKYDGIPPQYTC